MTWFPKRCIVVPVDFSDDSFNAVDVALQLVDEAKHLHVIHVLPAITEGEPGLLLSVLDEADRRDDVKRALAEKLADAKYADLKTVVAFGNPGHEIADYAANIKADLIVLPSRGRTGLKRMLLGSVAERVLRLARCPVLVLKN